MSTQTTLGFGYLRRFRHGRGPRKAFQAKATPTGGRGLGPWCSLFPAGSLCEVVLRSVSRTFWDCTPGSRHTPLPGLSFLLVTLSGKTLTMNEDLGLLVSELLDRISVLSALPSSAFHLTFGHKRLKESDTLKSAGLERDALLRMRGRLLGGTSRGPRNPQVPGSWHCSVCNLGGCWPGRDHCFRCLTPRFANTRRPPRESHFPEPTMRCVHLVRNLRLNRAHVLLLLRLPSRRLPFPQGTLRLCSKLPRG